MLHRQFRVVFIWPAVTTVTTIICVICQLFIKVTRRLPLGALWFFCLYWLKYPPLNSTTAFPKRGSLSLSDLFLASVGSSNCILWNQENFEDQWSLETFEIPAKGKYSFDKCLLHSTESCFAFPMPCFCKRIYLSMAAWGEQGIHRKT